MAYLPMTALLLGALVLTMVTARLQHRYYLKTVNRLAAGHRRSGTALVSGVGKGRLRGAIVIVAVRRTDGVIEEALVMQGSSVFARFRQLASLRGKSLVRLGDIDGRNLSSDMKRALLNAADQYRRLQYPEADEAGDVGLESDSAISARRSGGFVGPLSWVLGKVRVMVGGVQHA